MDIKSQKDPEQFDTKQSALWFIVLPLVLSVFISVLLILQIRFLLDNARLVSKSQEITAQINYVRRLSVDLETGLRGYQLTKSKLYLDPYNTAIQVYDTEFSKLKTLISDNPEQLQNFRALSLLTQNYIIYGDNETRNFRKTLVTKESRVYEGKKLMDQIRAQFDRMIISEDALIVSRKLDVEKNSKVVITFIIILSIGLSLFLSVNLFNKLKDMAQRYNELLNEMLVSKRKVDEINTNLEKTVQVRTGELLAANQELEAFCYSVSHDLRAPLRGIDGFSQAVLEDYQETIGEEGKVFLNYIRQGVQKMGHLIDDLLNLSRITRSDVKKTEVNLTDIFNQIKKEIVSYNPRSGDHNEDFFNTEPNLIAYGDAGMIRVVLENLMSNAWKFTKNNSTPRIHLGVQNRDSQKVYFLQDNGVGFDMQFKDKLFNAFQRLHSAAEYGGTGIGLATVKRVILKHGGEVWVESRIGFGTTFYFTLPT